MFLPFMIKVKKRVKKNKGRAEGVFRVKKSRKDIILRKKTLSLICFSVLLVLAFLLSLKYDSIIVKYFSYLRFSYLNYFMLTINFLSSGAILLIIISAIFLTGDKIKKFFRLWITLIISYCAGTLLKIAFNRARPFQAGVVSTFEQLMESSFNSWNSSFPSLHAIMVFCIFPLLSDESKALKVSWLIFALLVSFSRVYLGVHYLGDIISGAVIGYLIGFCILQITKYLNAKKNK